MWLKNMKINFLLLVKFDSELIFFVRCRVVILALYVKFNLNMNVIQCNTIRSNVLNLFLNKQKRIVSIDLVKISTNWSSDLTSSSETSPLAIWSFKKDDDDYQCQCAWLSLRPFISQLVVSWVLRKKGPVMSKPSNTESNQSNIWCRNATMQVY